MYVVLEMYIQLVQYYSGTLVQYFSGTPCVCRLRGVYIHLVQYFSVQPVYIVLEVYTPSAVLQCSPCVCSLTGVYIHLVEYYSCTPCLCSLTGVYTWCNITVVRPVYVVLQAYTPSAMLQ